MTNIRRLFLIMTKNQIEFRKAKEAERSNREQEKIGRDQAKAALSAAKSRHVKNLVEAAKGLGSAAGSTLSAAFNDIKWYTKLSKITDSLGKLSLRNPLGYGKTYTIRQITSTGTIVPVSEQGAAPGIMAFEFAPLLGAHGAQSDAVNTAAQNFYVYVRHANSGSANYEASDMAKMFMVADTVFTWLAHLRRCYRMAISYSEMNRYFNDGFKLATNIDLSVIRSNPLAFLGQLNRVIAKANTIKIPKDISFIDRHIWMVDHVWKDTSLDKAQLYLFYPGYILDNLDWEHNFLGYSKVFPDQPTGSKSLAAASFDPLALLARVEGIIDNIVANEDFGIMWGDILKAYGNANCFQMLPCNETDKLIAEYEPEVLEQIRNIVIIGSLATNSMYIYDEGANAANPKTNLVSQGQMTVDSQGFPQTTLDEVLVASIGANSAFFEVDTLPINSSKDDPTPNDIIINSRLMATTKATAALGTAGNDRVKLDVFGTEVVTDAYVILSTLANTGVTNLIGYKIPAAAVIATTYNDQIVLMAGGLLRSFQSSPVLISYAQTLSVLAFSVDTLNRRFVSSDWLRPLHEACVLSEWSIPMISLLQ